MFYNTYHPNKSAHKTFAVASTRRCGNWDVERLRFILSTALSLYIFPLGYEALSKPGLFSGKLWKSRGGADESVIHEHIKERGDVTFGLMLKYEAQLHRERRGMKWGDECAGWKQRRSLSYRTEVLMAWSRAEDTLICMKDRDKCRSEMQAKADRTRTRWT